jgi:hypothetical protein
VSRRVSKLLLAAGAWTVFIWVTRLVNMAGEDRSAGFYVVHGALAVISIGCEGASMNAYTSDRSPPIAVLL